MHYGDVEYDMPTRREVYYDAGIESGREMVVVVVVVVVAVTRFLHN